MGTGTTLQHQLPTTFAQTPTATPQGFQAGVTTTDAPLTTQEMGTPEGGAQDTFGQATPTVIASSFPFVTPHVFAPISADHLLPQNAPRLVPNMGLVVAASALAVLSYGRDVHAQTTGFSQEEMFLGISTVAFIAIGIVVILVLNRLDRKKAAPTADPKVSAPPTEYYDSPPEESPLPKTGAVSRERVELPVFSPSPDTSDKKPKTLPDDDRPVVTLEEPTDPDGMKVPEDNLADRLVESLERPQLPTLQNPATLLSPNMGFLPLGPGAQPPAPTAAVRPAGALPQPNLQAAQPSAGPLRLPFSPRVPALPRTKEPARPLPKVPAQRPEATQTRGLQLGVDVPKPDAPPPTISTPPQGTAAVVAPPPRPAPATTPPPAASPLVAPAVVTANPPPREKDSSPSGTRSLPPQQGQGGNSDHKQSQNGSRPQIPDEPMTEERIRTLFQTTRCCDQDTLLAIYKDSGLLEQIVKLALKTNPDSQTLATFKTLETFVEEVNRILIDTKNFGDAFKEIDPKQGPISFQNLADTYNSVSTYLNSPKDRISETTMNQNQNQKQKPNIFYVIAQSIASVLMTLKKPRETKLKKIYENLSNENLKKDSTITVLREPPSTISNLTPPPATPAVAPQPPAPSPPKR